MDIVMTVAGSDSGGGAGIQADLKTFQELDVFGTSVITALTAQNTQGVDGIFPVDAGFVVQQMAAVLCDMPVRAIRRACCFQPTSSGRFPTYWLKKMLFSSSIPS